MCKPFNGKMKEFKWRPGIFKKRLNQVDIYSLFCPILNDERFQRTFKRLVLFAELEEWNIQPPCHWNYKLAPEELKIKLMNTECSCGINTDEIHYMDMNALEINEEGKIIFTSDHDVDFGFGGFYDIQMWTNAEEEKVQKLVNKMERSDEKTRKRVKSQIVKFINKTMAAYEQDVLRFEFYTILEARLSKLNEESTTRTETKPPVIHIPKRTMSSRQKRIQADAIQAAKDAEEARMKQLEKKKTEISTSENQKKKKTAKAHNFFRKSQKPAKL